MKEWICKENAVTAFTIGQTYLTNSRGFLIDDDGDKRLKPEFYNHTYPGMFKEVVTLDNK